MSAYILRRLLLMIPTLLGILLLNFAIVQLAPGGPVERLVLQLTDPSHAQDTRFSAGGDMKAGDSGLATLPAQSLNPQGAYRGARGLDPQLIADIERQYGFDKPAHERFIKMLGDYLTLDFGTSFFRDEPVIDLIIDKLPVSVSLGLWTTLIVYLISIPLGIAKARRDGSRFDVWTSSAIIVGYAIPSFLFAILLIILFAGGSYWQIFPMRGLTSDGFDEMSTLAQIKDYFWHITLPVMAMVISGFASLTLLTKNSSAVTRPASSLIVTGMNPP